MALLSSAAAAIALLGCGGATHHSPPARVPSPYAAARAGVCGSPNRASVARSLGVAAASVVTRRTRDNTGAPECVFEARAGGRPVVVELSVNGEHQAYALMERQGEELAQLFGARRLSPAPIGIFHLGLGAFWYPAQQQLQTTDAVDLITVTIVRWPGVGGPRRRRLAVALARGSLGPPQPKLARGEA